MAQVWSAVLATTFLASLVLLGRHNPWGWVLGIADELLWIAYAITTRQWAFIISATVYLTVCGRNLRAWRGVPARRPRSVSKLGRGRWRQCRRPSRAGSARA
jgi:hypothetical protein